MYIDINAFEYRCTSNRLELPQHRCILNFLAVRFINITKLGLRILCMGSPIWGLNERARAFDDDDDDDDNKLDDNGDEYEYKCTYENKNSPGLWPIGVLDPLRARRRLGRVGFYHHRSYQIESFPRIYS